MAELTEPSGYWTFLMGSAIHCRPRSTLVEVRDGFRVEMDIELDRSLMRYVASRVSVQREEEGTEVTMRVLRTVTVQKDIAALALKEMVTVDTSDLSSERATMAALEWLREVEHGRGHRDEMDQDELVGIIYTLAKLGNWPPLRIVGEVMGVSQSTATRMVSRARRNVEYFDG